MGASPLVGSWQFTRETPQGTRTSTLLVKENMTGTYTVRDTAYDIQDLKVDGNAVTFKVTVKYGENEVPMEFKGTLEGTELKGAFTTERGTREAVGKKQS